MQVTLVGICGDSGAGKSTYINHVKRILGQNQVTVIGLDDYHTLDRKERKAISVTPLHPRANDLGLVADHATLLKRGQRVLKPVYDHNTGEFAPPEWVDPNRYVIMEGLHPFHLTVQREALDLKLYLDTHKDLKIKWKIERDARDRGYTREQVIAEIEQRQKDIKAFIEPQIKYADVVISLIENDNPEYAAAAPVKVRISERPSEQGIIRNLLLAGWGERLGVTLEKVNIEGTDMEAIELTRPLDHAELRELVSALGNGAALNLPEGPADPWVQSQVLVSWRIANINAQEVGQKSYAV